LEVSKGGELIPENKRAHAHRDGERIDGGGISNSHLW